MKLVLRRLQDSAFSLNDKFLDSPDLKEFADDNFEFDEIDGNFFKRIENTVERGEIARYEQFLLFSQCFSKDFYHRHVKTRACLEKGE